MQMVVWGSQAMREAYHAGIQPRSGQRSGQRDGWLATVSRQAQLLWWVQGCVAAIAIAGVLDVLGVTRKDWFRVVHAIGAQWMDWTRQLSAWLATRLPFGWELGAREATFFFLVAVTILPIMISQAIANSRHTETTDRVMSYVGLAFVLYGMGIVLAPGNIENTPGVFASAVAATCVGFILAVGMTGNHIADRNIQRSKVLGLGPIIVLIAGKQLGWETSGDAFLVAAACASLTAVISLGAIMLKVARPYVVAFVATLAFFGVLEILTWIPAIEQQLIPYLS